MILKLLIGILLLFGVIYIVYFLYIVLKHLRKTNPFEDKNYELATYEEKKQRKTDVKRFISISWVFTLLFLLIFILTLFGLKI